MFKEPKTQLHQPISFQEHMPVKDEKGDKQQGFCLKVRTLITDKKVGVFIYIHIYMHIYSYLHLENCKFNTLEVIY